MWVAPEKSDNVRINSSKFVHLLTKSGLFISRARLTTCCYVTAYASSGPFLVSRKVPYATTAAKHAGSSSPQQAERNLCMHAC